MSYSCEKLIQGVQIEHNVVTLREEHRLRVFGNRMLRIFGPKRDEVTGG
jgi:hypothetical protein